jgi:menaquinone-9 beta-reductase
VVHAGGRWSNVPAGPQPVSNMSHKWLGLKAHFTEPMPELSVDLYFFEGGYCGVQPVALHNHGNSAQINACAMVRADIASSLPAVFEQSDELRKRSRNWTPLSDPVTTSPLLFREPQPIAGSMLKVGDTAGFVDPFVGDGISLALRSGCLAAESLTPFFHDRCSLEIAATHYRELYTRQLLPVFRASSKLRRLMLLPKTLRGPLLFMLENSPVITRYLVSRTRVAV